MRFILFFILLGIGISSCQEKATTEEKPNILFILMDDLGYGQFGIYNDTITVNNFDPFFTHLVDSLQGYSKEKALEFSKTAIPTLTSLANNGILFTNAHTSSNLCAPSRLGIATGTNQVRWGVYRNIDCEKHGIVPGTHLAEKIKEQGYQTAHIGKWHIGTHDKKVIKETLAKFDVPENTSQKELKQKFPDAYKAVRNCGYQGSVIEEHNPRNNGFDYYFGYNTWGSQYYNSTLVWENFEHTGKQTEYNTDAFSNKAMDFMGEQLENNESFYVQLHYHAVHDSVEPRAPEKYLNHFDSDSFELNNFYAHVYGVDQNVKRIVEFLKAKGQYENTLIVFTSDNGGMCGGSYNGHKSGSPLPGNAPFSGHKGNYYQGGVRVPMFVHWPAGIKQNGVSHNLVSTMDILPTAVDVAGGTVPSNIDGKSLTPLMFNQNSAPIHKHLVWAGIHSAKWGYHIMKTTKSHADEDDFAPPAWLVVEGDYLLRFVGKREPGVYLDYMNGNDATYQLYNIKSDPAEKINLAHKLPEKVNELAKLYFSEAKDFPPPARWKKEKCEELKDSEKLFEINN